MDRGAAWALGMALIQTEPPVDGLTVEIAGRRATTVDGGIAELKDLTLGEQRVTIDGQGYAYDGTIMISDGLHAVLTAVLETPPPVTENSNSPPKQPSRVSKPEAWAGLHIDTHVGGAGVYIDGRLVARTDHGGGAECRTTPGRHEVELRHEAFRDWVEVHTLREGLHTTLRPVMKPDSNTRPSWFLPALLVLTVAALLVIIAIIWLKRLGSRSSENRFGPYEIKGELGTGGMAILYRAKDTRNGEMVALKVMNSNLVRDPDLVRRFLQEGVILRQLNTLAPDAPIVRVRSYAGEDGQEGTWPYLALELLQGETLQARLRRKGSLGVEGSLPILWQVVAALNTAHAAGIYHRDLTPDNIMLVPGENGTVRVRLIDFGVAKHEYVSHHTMDGSVMGKPPYMAPEQFQGKMVEGRTDIYSAGMMVYHMIDGSPPFTSTNPMEVMRRHEQEMPPPLGANTPEWLRRLTLAMVAKEPSERPEASHVLKQISAHSIPGAQGGKV